MRVLIVTHSSVSKGGLFVGWLREEGHEVVPWSFREQDCAPARDSFDAVVLFGGGMNVGEEGRYPWLRHEEEFIHSLVGGQTPMLGICLGAQLMAHTLGGTVRKLPEPEFGWQPVELTDAGRKDPLLSALPEQFMALEWHRYAFEPDSRDDVLATSARCNQAFRAGEHQWGVQFHPEGGLDQTTAWLKGDREMASAGGGYLGELGRDYDDVMVELRTVMPDWNQLGEKLCRRFAVLADARSRRNSTIKVAA